MDIISIGSDGDIYWGMMEMHVKHSQLLGIGLLALIAPFSIAFADPAGDVTLARQAVDREDLPEAERLYRKAAEANYLPAEVELGDLMHAQQENEAAFGWYMTAAYQGDAAAAYNMAQMYVTGEGVEKNLEKALYWIKLAAGKNYLPAQEVLISAYKTGDLGLKIDLEQAKNWEAKAAALRAAAKKTAEQEIAASRAARRAVNQAAAKEAADRQAEAIKAGDEAAAKKVDDADK